MRAVTIAVAGLLLLLSAAPSGGLRHGARRRTAARQEIFRLQQANLLSTILSGGASGGLDTLTEQHDEELLLRHGAIQWRSPETDRVVSEDGRARLPLTLALDKETGEMSMVAAERFLEGDEDAAVTLCHVPPSLRRKPLQALAIGDSPKP
uniref:Uncharacterized protein n=1 Tax=Phaeomonas parva TaxID=124430 RepID=A0A7S1U7H8_9STRA|mmetsp:Transcript_35107/g.110510  ORF Transcript_35107/g.110510 Transcript_35107/m.110510 type:complete len:151 (+) Transcript_35107:125-577(+)